VGLKEEPPGLDPSIKRCVLFLIKNFTKRNVTILPARDWRAALHLRLMCLQFTYFAHLGQRTKEAVFTFGLDLCRMSCP
jgi:hypothetical protein